MNIGKACAIFAQIESDKYTDLEKGIAVYMVMAMPTHNGITKDAMLRVIRWMFRRYSRSRMPTMINHQTFTIPFKLPSLNDYINACRTNPHVGANMKKSVGESIGWEIKIAKLRPVANPCVVVMTFVRADRRADVDNVKSAKKYILDALVSCGILQGDSPKWVVAAPSFTVYDKGARVIVELIDGNLDELHALVKNARAAYEVGE